MNGKEGAKGREGRERGGKVRLGYLSKGSRVPSYATEHIQPIIAPQLLLSAWLGSGVVSVLDSGAVGRGGSRPKYLGLATPFPFPYPSSTFPIPFPSPPPHSSSPPLLLPPLRSMPLKYSYGVWGSAVSSPSAVWGRAPVEIEFCAFQL